MKSVRYTGIISAFFFAAAGIVAVFSLSSLSLLAMSVAFLFGLQTMRNIDRRASFNARKTSLQVISLNGKVDRLLTEIAAERKGTGMLYREVRGLRSELSDIGAQTDALGEQRLVTGLRALNVVKRELEDQINVPLHLAPQHEK